MTRLLALVPMLGLAAIAAAAAPTQNAEAAPGRVGYDRWCGTCHADAPRMPGTIALAVKYGGARPGALERWESVPRALTIYAVRNGVGPMPRFRKTEISDAELERIAAYLAGPKR